jgi:hypothetical protein
VGSVRSSFQKLILYRDLRRNAESSLSAIPPNSTYFSAICRVAKNFAGTRQTAALRSCFFVVLMAPNKGTMPAVAGENV